MRKYRNKASKRVVLFSFSLERERERERERAKGEQGGRKRGQKHKKLSLFFLVPAKERRNPKKKIERRVLSRARRSPLKNTKKQAKKARTRDPPLREREMKERRNALGIITLHTHDNTRFHHGTQTNLETVHLQNDRVRAFIEPSERCANVQHRHRGVEIRELARVVRSYKLVLPISVNFRFGGVPPFVVFGNTFFCFLSLSSVFLSLCDVYVSCAHRVNESEGDEFGRWKREREKEREKSERTRAKFTPHRDER